MKQVVSKTEFSELVRAITWRLNTSNLQTTFVSRQAEEILGYPSASWLTEQSFWKDHIHPADRDRVAALAAKAIADGCQQELEYRMIAADGRIVWLRGVVNLVSGNGQDRELAGVSVDITELKQAEEALRRREANYRLFVSQSSEGIFCQELDSPIPVDLPEEELIRRILHQSYMAECNEALARMYGIDSPAEFIGKRLTETLDAEDPANIELTREYIRSGYRVLERESREVDAKGNPKLFLNSMIGIVENGMLLRTWGIQRDVTDRRRADEQLHQREELLRLAAQAGGMYAYDWDVHRNTVVRSAESANTLPGSSDAKVLSYEQVLAQVHPDDRAKFSTVLEKVTPQNPTCQLTYRVLRPDGSVGWREKTARAYFDEQGRLLRMIGMVADITQRKQTEEAFWQSELRYKEVFDNTSDGVFIVDVTDEGRFKLATFNPAEESSIGLSNAEVSGKFVEDVLSAEVAQRVIGNYRRCMEVGAVINYDEELELGTGRRYFHTTLIPLRDTDQRIYRIIGVARDVTDRTRSEELLREGSERLRLAVKAGRMYAFEWDARTDAIARSGESGEILTWLNDPAHDTGRDFLTRIHPEDRSSYIKSETSSTPENPAYQTSYRVLRPDGSLVWLEESGHAFFDDQGKILRIFGMVVDATARKQAEEATRASETKFSRLFQASPALMGLSTISNDRFIDVNEAFTRATGYSRSEMIGRSAVELGICLDPVCHRDLMVKLAAEGNVRDLELPFGTKTRDTRTGLLSSEVIEIGGERCVLTLISDITERKRAELARRESEERFRLVANHAPVLIWMSGPDKLCNYFNQPWLEFTGRSLQVESGNGWAEGVHPDDLHRCMETYTEAFERRQNFRMDYRLRRHDGEYRWMDDTGIPRFNADGSFAGYIGSCIDVTDSRRAQKELVDLSGRLISAQEEERTRLARELHDDLSQRLALMAIELETLSHNLPDSKAAITRSLRTLWQRVTDISVGVHELSHRLHPSILDRVGLVPALRSLCRGVQQQSGINITSTLREIPEVMPDEVSLCLYRVFQEALANVMKHSGATDVQIELHAAGEQLKLRIADNGRGFAPDASTQTGLGLLSMKERVRLIGGEIEIRANSAHGTEITAEIPLARCRLPEARLGKSA